jgi:hypothetical protein
MMIGKTRKPENNEDYMRSLFLFLTAPFIISACIDTTTQSGGAGATSCRGIYYDRNQYGDLRKYNEYERKGQCWTDNLALSTWESSSERRRRMEVSCIAQPGFSSKTLASANNFYAYRDDRLYMDFDSSTGIYRRLVLGESDDGAHQTFTRDLGCFWQKTGVGIDAIHGTQLMLDTEYAASSEEFQPTEIFKYVDGGATVEMIRYDDSGAWDYRFCPELSAPWGYCDLLRNGNVMFFPVLSVAEMASLVSEALLIRKQFNFRVVDKSVFEELWAEAPTTLTEIGRNNWRYMVNGVPDAPLYTDVAWREYIKGLTPHMPDTTSSNMPPICYQGHQAVTLSDGSIGRIFGEICYVNGEFTFTQN